LWKRQGIFTAHTARSRQADRPAQLPRVHCACDVGPLGFATNVSSQEPVRNRWPTRYGLKDLKIDETVLCVREAGVSCSENRAGHGAGIRVF
jgi:hypothetical protein